MKIGSRIQAGIGLIIFSHLALAEELTCNVDAQLFYEARAIYSCELSKEAYRLYLEAAKAGVKDVVEPLRPSYCKENSYRLDHAIAAALIGAGGGALVTDKRLAAINQKRSVEARRMMVTANESLQRGRKYGLMYVLESMQQGVAGNSTPKQIQAVREFVKTMNLAQMRVGSQGFDIVDRVVSPAGFGADLKIKQITAYSVKYNLALSPQTIKELASIPPEKFGDLRSTINFADGAAHAKSELAESTTSRFRKSQLELGKNIKKARPLRFAGIASLVLGAGYLLLNSKSEDDQADPVMSIEEAVLEKMATWPLDKPIVIDEKFTQEHCNMLREMLADTKLEAKLTEDQNKCVDDQWLKLDLKSPAGESPRAYRVYRAYDGYVITAKNLRTHNFDRTPTSEEVEIVKQVYDDQVDLIRSQNAEYKGCIPRTRKTKKQAVLEE